MVLIWYILVSLRYNGAHAFDNGTWNNIKTEKCSEICWNDEDVPKHKNNVYNYENFYEKDYNDNHEHHNNKNRRNQNNNNNKNDDDKNNDNDTESIKNQFR